MLDFVHYMRKAFSSLCQGFGFYLPNKVKFKVIKYCLRHHLLKLGPSPLRNSALIDPFFLLYLFRLMGLIGMGGSGSKMVYKEFVDLFHQQLIVPTSNRTSNEEFTHNSHKNTLVIHHKLKQICNENDVID